MVIVMTAGLLLVLNRRRDVAYIGEPVIWIGWRIIVRHVPRQLLKKALLGMVMLEYALSQQKLVFPALMLHWQDSHVLSVLLFFVLGLG